MNVLIQFHTNAAIAILRMKAVDFTMYKTILKVYLRCHKTSGSTIIEVIDVKLASI